MRCFFYTPAVLLLYFNSVILQLCTELPKLNGRHYLYIYIVFQNTLRALNLAGTYFRRFRGFRGFLEKFLISRELIFVRKRPNFVDLLLFSEFFLKISWKTSKSVISRNLYSQIWHNKKLRGHLFSRFLYQKNAKINSRENKFTWD